MSFNADRLDALTYHMGKKEMQDHPVQSGKGMRLPRRQSRKTGNKRIGCKRHAPALSPVRRRVASCAIFMAGVAVVTLGGKIRLVGEIWTGERLGMKSNVPGSKMVQVKGVMLLMQPTP